jgi:NAD(P)H-hydrate repair Nnr-like enzyme with NAD(P)H-hydrate dehydratase domain
MLVNLPDAMTVQFKSLNNVWLENIAVHFYLKINLFSIWVPISEERKSNPRKPYLGVLARIAESLYSGGRPPASGSASAYVGSGVTSYFASGSESTISPNLI